MKTIAISNQKGGVGKTTTSVCLAHALAIKGKQVLLIDLDPQGQVATALGLDRDPGVFNLLVAGRAAANVIRSSGRPNLSVITGDKSTATAQIVIEAQHQPVSFLRDLLKPFGKSGLDYVVLDTSPSIGGLQELALFAADTVLIPTAVDYLSSDGVASVIETLNTLRRNHQWPGTLLGILPTFSDDTTRASAENLTALRHVYSEYVLKPIHRATVLRECVAEGLTLWEKDAGSRAAFEYAAVLHYMLERVA